MPLNTVDASMTTGLLKTDNKLSELAQEYATQTETMVNVGLNAAIPIGSVIVWTRNVLPAGFLSCNGSAVSRTAYASLFSLIGTNYGAGDGTTTFNVPNITGGLTVSSGSLYYLIKASTESNLLPL